MRNTVYHLNPPVSIALLSDLHERPLAPVLDSLRSRRPDLIAVAGDLLDGIRQPDPAGHMASMLRDLNAIAPTFLSLGNHDWQLTSEAAREMPSILDNRWAVWRGIVIGGLSSAVRSRSLFLQHTPGKAPDTAWLRDFCAVPGYRILLCHHPEYYPRYLSGLPIDLVLAGHAHGGQCQILGRGVYAPGQGLFPRLTSGVHYGGRLVISRGLANTAPVPRLFNPTEVVWLPAGGRKHP